MSKLSNFIDDINWSEVFMLIQTLAGLKAQHDPDNGVDFSQAIANTQVALENHPVNQNAETYVDPIDRPTDTNTGAA